MKIRIKEKQLKQLNESYLIEDDGSIAKEQKPSAFDEFEADAKYQYIIQRKKEALPVSIVLPNIFDLPVKLPNPPEDISNIMSSYQVNKARKTQNIGGVMQDPIQTYNNADACCKDAFGNFAQIKFETDEKQRKVNQSYINKSNESYNYNGFPVLNESPAAFGYAVGKTVGNVAGGVISAGAGGIAGLAAGVGLEAAAICAGLYGIGYTGQEIFGNVEGGGGTNDKKAAHLNDVRQKMLTPTPANPQQYGDIVEAITNYVKNIMEACTDVASLLTSEGAQKMDDLTAFVNGLMTTTSKKAQEYIESHSKQIEEQKELERQKRETKLQSDTIKSDKVKNFIKNAQSAMTASSTNFGNDLKLLEKINTAYEKNVNNSKGFDLETALENGWDALKTKYLELFPEKGQNSQPTAEEESVETNGTSLNEATPQQDSSMSGIKNGNSDSSKKLVIKANEIYNSLLLEFEKRFKEAFSTMDVKNLPKYEETKQQMQDLIDEANKSINSKIEQITKVQNGETSGTGGLGQAAKVFLMGHPLEANNLREVWSRHLVDLKSRMTNRLAQMTDYKNKTRTLGWTWQVCRTVMPKILARMLTYRYIYAILSNEGFFSYDTETMKQDEQAFNNDKQIYVGLAKSKLIWLLNQSVDYTAKGGKILIQDETNGGWRISDDNLAYAFFLVSRLSGTKSNEQIKKTTGKVSQFLSNIKAYVKEEDQVNNLLIVVKNCMSSANQKLLNSQNPDEFNQLADVFKMPDDIKNLKNEILQTYKDLKQKSNDVPNDNDRNKLVNIAKTKDIVYNHPKDIYVTYLKNKGIIDKYIDEINGTQEIDENKKKEIKDKLLNIFGDIINEDEIKDNNYNDITKESILSLFPDPNAKNDYYSAILYIYPSGLKDIVWDDKGASLVTTTPEAITQVCKVTKIMVPFMLSGILGYVMDDTKSDDQLTDNTSLLNEMANAWQSGNIAKLYDLVNPENSERFDSAYDNIKEKEKLKELLAKGPFNILQNSNLISEFKKDYENKKDSLSLAISNPDLLNQKLSFNNKFNDLVASIEPELKNRKNILAILTANENTEGENKEIKLKKDDDTIKQQIDSLKQIISFILEVAVNTLLDQEAGEVKIITDDDLTKSINILGNMNQNAIKILGVNQYLNNNDNFKGMDANIVGKNVNKFKNAYDEFKKLYVNDFISISKKYKLTVNDIDTIFNSFAKYTKVDKLLHSNLNNINIMDGECSETDRKNAMYYYIEVLKSENIKHIMPINNFINAINLITKKLSN